MSRFQAQTNAVLDAQLEDLRVQLGLRTNQKAELLREIAGLAAWVVRQSASGREVEARGPSGVERLRNPILDRLRITAVVTEPGKGGKANTSEVREPAGRGFTPTLLLSEEEVERLAAILDRGFSPTPALRAALARLAGESRSLPSLRWPETAGPEAEGEA